MKKLISATSGLLMTVGALTAPVVLLTAGQATARPQCDQAGTKVVITGHAFHPAKGIKAMSSVSGDPGVTLSIATNKSYSVSGSITTGFKASAGVIFAKVESSVSVTVGGSYTHTNQISGAWKVPHTKKYRHGGTLQIGAMHYYGTVRKWHQSPTQTSGCKTVWGKVGHFDAPTRSFYFHHFADKNG